jgi:hypothetical protein
LNKTTSFGVIWEDLKVSFRFAVKNIASFFLAMIGVVIVSGILLVLVFGFLFLGLFLATGGISGLIQYFTDLSLSFETFNVGTMGLGMLLLVPLLSPVFVAIGALFGMGREIVESEGTSVEGVFTWYRRKFIPLAGGGIILFLLTILPPAISFAFAYELMGFNPPVSILSILAVFTFIWIILVTGSLSMMFPAIIDGEGAIDATIKSIRMSWKYFDRVFGVWLGILTIIFAFFLPLIAIPTSFWGTPDAISLGGIIAAVYALPVMIIVVLVFIPAAAIALSRVYLILTGFEFDSESPKEDGPGLSFVGGI